MNSQQVNFAVHDLATAIRFYSAMFASAPAVLKPDCAKWMLNDPRVSFTIFAPDAARGDTRAGWECVGLLSTQSTRSGGLSVTNGSRPKLPLEI